MKSVYSSHAHTNTRAKSPKEEKATKKQKNNNKNLHVPQSQLKEVQLKHHHKYWIHEVGQSRGNENHYCCCCCCHLTRSPRWMVS